MSNAVAEPTRTGDLPLKGGKEKNTIGLDGKTVIKEKPDSLVVERAKDYGHALDQVEIAKHRATELGAELEAAFKKSKKAQKVRVQTDRRVWTFRMTQSSRLEKKKEGEIK